MSKIKHTVSALLDRIMVAAFIAVAFWPEVMAVVIASVIATFFAVTR